jgi:hypothetical protein
MRVPIKILGYRKAQRYAVRRAIEQALNTLSLKQIHFDVTIEEITSVQEILKFTQVLIYPSVVLNDKVICSGRIPKQSEMEQWILQELKKNSKNV